MGHKTGGAAAGVYNRRWPQCVPRPGDRSPQASLASLPVAFPRGPVLIRHCLVAAAAGSKRGIRTVLKLHSQPDHADGLIQTAGGSEGISACASIMPSARRFAAHSSRLGSHPPMRARCTS